MIFMALAWDAVFKKISVKYIFIFLAICSIFIQVVGAFCYPGGWNSVPVSVDLDHSRVWDWKDTQILRCIKGGPRKAWFIWFIKSSLKGDGEPYFEKDSSQFKNFLQGS